MFEFKVLESIINCLSQFVILNVILKERFEHLSDVLINQTSFTDCSRMLRARSRSVVSDTIIENDVDSDSDFDSIIKRV